MPITGFQERAHNTNTAAICAKHGCSVAVWSSSQATELKNARYKSNSKIWELPKSERSATLGGKETHHFDSLPNTDWEGTSINTVYMNQTLQNAHLHDVPKLFSLATLTDRVMLETALCVSVPVAIVVAALGASSTDLKLVILMLTEVLAYKC
jgi:hypothetical protein